MESMKGAISAITLTENADVVEMPMSEAVRTLSLLARWAIRGYQKQLNSEEKSKAKTLTNNISNSYMVKKGEKSVDKQVARGNIA
jgi:hypothetical protein